MKSKTYPVEILQEIASISNSLSSLFKSSKTNLRAIAKFSGLSVNSVKSVLAGETANIGSYALVAKALGTTLTKVIANTYNTSTDTTVSTPQADVEVSHLLL